MSLIMSKITIATSSLNKKYLHQIDRNVFPEWLSKNGSKISILYHIGARTDTVETNIEIFNSLNLFYSKKSMEFMC